MTRSSHEKLGRHRLSIDQALTGMVRVCTATRAHLTGFSLTGTTPGCIVVATPIKEDP